MSLLAQIYWMPYVRKCTLTDKSWASRQEHCRLQYIPLSKNPLIFCQSQKNNSFYVALFLLSSYCFSLNDKFQYTNPTLSVFPFS
jgi:hypothetical protein